MCSEMQKNGQFKEQLIRSMDDCREKMGKILEYSAWLSIVLLALVLLHFSIVVFNHWKNSHTEFRL